MSDKIEQYIKCDPQIHHGKACFKGTRIPVYIVLELLEAGESPEDIIEDYPRLTMKHLRAAFHFAAEVLKNREYALFA